MKREERELFERQQELMQSLCEKLDRQHEQNTELIVRLKAIYNMFMKKFNALLKLMDGEVL